MYRYEYVSGKGIPALLDRELPLVGLEIGCDEGETAEFMLMQMPNLTLHVIDPYIDYVDWNSNFLHQREALFDAVKNRFAKYKDMFIMHRDYSDGAVNNFEDNSLDYIFIDGLHTYEQVLLDCKNYYCKVKDGGVFSGHDYNAIPGVRRAVQEYAASVGKTILETSQDVWYWIK